MSSATILFVLKDLLQSARTRQASTIAMAFGPGLTVESALLQRVGSATPHRGSRQATLQSLQEVMIHV